MEEDLPVWRETIKDDSLPFKDVLAEFKEVSSEEKLDRSERPSDTVTNFKQEPPLNVGQLVYLPDSSLYAKVISLSPATVSTQAEKICIDGIRWTRKVTITIKSGSLTMDYQIHVSAPILDQISEALATMSGKID
jgi:hypothetical protein